MPDEMNWEKWHQKLLIQACVLPFKHHDDVACSERLTRLFGEGGVCAEVAKLAYNRIWMGSFRYGIANVSGKSHEQRVKEGKDTTFIERGIEKFNLYLKTGNREYIVDAFNYCLLEWNSPQHPNAHFKATDREEI